MKRLNPKTNLPFKAGDIREDGKVFKQYRMSEKIKKNGFFIEEWISPNILKKIRNQEKQYKKQYVNTLHGRATKLLRAAKERHITSISLEWVEKKLEIGVCELTKLPFSLENLTNHKTNPYAPSLDRINSNIKEYSPENTRVVLLAVNLALNQWGCETISPIIKKLAKNI